MPQTVDLGGSYGVMEFPDDFTPEQIILEVRKAHPSLAPPKELPYPNWQLPIGRENPPVPLGPAAPMDFENPAFWNRVNRPQQLREQILSAASASQEALNAAERARIREETIRNNFDIIGATGRALIGAGKAMQAPVEDILNPPPGAIRNWFTGNPSANFPRTRALLSGAVEPQLSGVNVPPPSEPTPESKAQFAKEHPLAAQMAPYIGAAEKGTYGMVRTTPLLMGAAALQRVGIPQNVAFGMLSASEAGAQGADIPQMSQAFATGMAIPFAGHQGRVVAATVLNKAVDAGLLSAKRTTVQKAIEALGAQGGMQIFLAGMDFPEYYAAKPEDRLKLLTERTIENSVWFIPDLWHVRGGTPSFTQQKMEPLTAAASAMREAVKNPVFMGELQKYADRVAREQATPTAFPWREAGFEREDVPLANMPTEGPFTQNQPTKIPGVVNRPPGATKRNIPVTAERTPVNPEVPIAPGEGGELYESQVYRMRQDLVNRGYAPDVINRLDPAQVEGVWRRTAKDELSLEEQRQLGLGVGAAPPPVPRPRIRVSQDLSPEEKTRLGIAISPQERARLGLGQIRPVRMQTPTPVPPVAPELSPEERARLGMETTTQKGAQDATQIGPQPQNREPKYTGTAPGQDLRQNAAEIRKGEGEQAGRGDRLERGGTQPEAPGEPQENVGVPAFRNRLYPDRVVVVEPGDTRESLARKLNIPVEYVIPNQGAEVVRSIGPWSIMDYSYQYGHVDNTGKFWSKPARTFEIGRQVASNPEMRREFSQQEESLLRDLVREAYGLGNQYKLDRGQERALRAETQRALWTLKDPNRPNRLKQVMAEIKDTSEPIVTESVRSLENRLSDVQVEKMDVDARIAKVRKGTTPADLRLRKKLEGLRDEIQRRIDWVRQRLSIAVEQKPRKIRRGYSMMRRLESETDRTGPDIISYMATHPVMSRSQAKKLLGDRFNRNSSLWDDQPEKLSLPHHNMIYGGRQFPDQVAKGAYESGIIRENSVKALWNAVESASAKRAGSYKDIPENEYYAKSEKFFDAVAEGRGGEKILPQDLQVGDTIVVDGESFRVSEYDPDSGNYTLEDGRKFGTIEISDEYGPIYVEKYEPVESSAMEGWDKPEVATVPKPSGTQEPKPQTPAQRAVSVSRPQSLSELKAQFVAANGGRVTTEQADALGALIEGVAKYKGMTPDEYVQAKYGGVVAGGEPSGDALYKRVWWAKKYPGQAADLQAYLREARFGHDYDNYLDRTIGYLTEIAGRRTGTSAIRQNQKTLLSVDISGNCPLEQAGTGCLYCYVGNPREAFGGGTKGVSKSFEAAAYRSEDILGMPQELVNFLNRKLGGLRIFSNGDFKQANIPVLDQVIADARKRGLFLKVITKQPEMLSRYRDQKHVLFNLSTDWDTRNAKAIVDTAIRKLMDGGMDAVTAGITREKLMAVLSDKSARRMIGYGWDIEDARKATANNPRIAVRYVAVNRADAIRAIADPRVHVVTLYHGFTDPQLLVDLWRKRAPNVERMLGTKMTLALAHAFEYSKAPTFTGNVTAAELKDALGDKAPSITEFAKMAAKKFCCQTGRCSNCVVGCGFKHAEGLRVLGKMLDGEKLASIEFDADQRAVIRAFEKSNVAAMAHELGHSFRRDLRQEDLDSVERAYGILNGKWETKHEELWANQFERYLREGVAPTPALTRVFQQFKEWLKSIYQRLVGTPLGKSAIPPEVRETFRKMLGGEDRPRIYKNYGKSDLPESGRFIIAMRDPKTGDVVISDQDIHGTLKEKAGARFSEPGYIDEKGLFVTRTKIAQEKPVAPEPITTIQEAAQAVIRESNNPAAKAYAKSFLDTGDVGTLTYVLNNLQGWRGARAKEVKDFIKSGKTKPEIVPDLAKQNLEAVEPKSPETVDPRTLTDEQLAQEIAAVESVSSPLYDELNRMGARAFVKGKYSPQAQALDEQIKPWAQRKELLQSEQSRREIEARNKAANAARDKRVAEAPVFQRRNGWEIVKDGGSYVLRDPYTKEDIYRGSLRRAREVADESKPEKPEGYVAPAAETAAEPDKYAGDAAEGTRVDNFVKRNGRWYTVAEDGTIGKIPRPPKHHAVLEAKAKAPPEPEDTRTPEEVISQSPYVQIVLPKDGTMVRITYRKRGELVQRVFNKSEFEGENPWAGAGADIVKFEAGRIGRGNEFIPVEGVRVKEVSEKSIPSAEFPETLPKATSDSKFPNIPLSTGNYYLVGTYGDFGLYEAQNQRMAMGKVLKVLHLPTGWLQRAPDKITASRMASRYEGTLKGVPPDYGGKDGWGNTPKFSWQKVKEGSQKLTQQPAYHYGDEGVALDTMLRRMDAGRSTGHYGTGVYFLGKPDPKSREGRPLKMLDLSGLNLAKPSPEDVFHLHDGLRDFNRAIFRNEPLDFSEPRFAGSKVLFNLRISLWMAKHSEEQIRTAMQNVEAMFREKRNDGTRTPSTYLMQELGYDGIDVRGTKADNTDYGSVIFAKPAPAPNVEVGGKAATLTPPGESSNLLPAYHGTPHEVDRFSTSKIGTGEGPLSTRTADTIRLETPDQIRAGIETLDLPQNTKRALKWLVDSGMMDRLPGLRFEIVDAIEGEAQGEYIASQRLARFSKWAESETPVHEFFHHVWLWLSPEDKNFIRQLRKEFIGREVSDPELAKTLRDGWITSDDFLSRGIDPALYHLSNPSEFFTWMFTNKAKERMETPEAQGFVSKLVKLFKDLWTGFKDWMEMTPYQDRMWRKILGGTYEYNMGDAKAFAQANPAAREASIWGTSDRPFGVEREVLLAAGEAARAAALEGRSAEEASEAGMAIIRERSPQGYRDAAVRAYLQARAATARGQVSAEPPTLPPTSEREPMGAEPSERHTVGGRRRIGSEYPPQSIPATIDRIRTGYFDGRQSVETGRTQRAWDLAIQLSNPDTRYALYQDLVTASGENQMGPAALVNELRDYSLRLAMAGDPRLMRYMISRNQEFATAFGGVTEAARALRMAREGADQPLWQALWDLTEARVRSAGRTVGQGETAIRELLRTMEILRLTPEELEERLRQPGATGPSGRTVPEMLDEQNEATSEAERILDKYERSQTEWLKPDGRLSAIRQIIKDAIETGPQGRYQNEGDFVRRISERFQAEEVPVDISDRLAAEVWKDKVARESAATAKAVYAEERREANNAYRLLDQYAQEQVEWVKPERKNLTRDLVKQYLKRVVNANNQESFIRSLGNELVGIGVPEVPARELARQVWDRKRTLDDAAIARQMDAEIRRAAELAEKTALRYADQMEKKYGAEWLKPNSRNEVLEILKRASRFGLTTKEEKELATLEAAEADGTASAEQIVRLADLRAAAFPVAMRSEFIKKLSADLEAAGVKPETAYRAATLVYDDRSIRWNNAQTRAFERAKESKSIKSLLEAIQTSPYLAQQNPEWIRETAENWFMSNGLNRDQAREAAKLFQEQYREAMAVAAEKAARKVLERGPVRNMPEIIAAIRAGILDPSKDWVTRLAMKSGFTELTDEQFSKIAELESKYSRPNITPHEKAQISEQIMGILRHVGVHEGSLLRAMAESYAYSLLSGVRTATLQVFQPAVSLAHDLISQAIMEPKNAGVLIKALLAAAKNWAPEVKFGWQKDAFSFANNEYVLQHRELKRQFELAQKELEAKKPMGALRMLYAWQQYITRMFSAFDQGSMSTMREFKMVLYGSMVMRDAGFSTRQISDLVDIIQGYKRAAYEEALYRGRTPNEARVDADDAAAEQVYNFFSNKFGSSTADAVVSAAENDAYSFVGRKGPRLSEEGDEGMLSKIPAPFIQMASRMRGQGGLGSILSIALFGFVAVPWRSIRYAANFSPYGLLRYGVHRWRTNRGMDTWWKQSYATEQQARARFREAVIGTALTAAFFGWQFSHSSADDDATNTAFGMLATGAGPKSKELRDAWIQKGFRPYSVHVILDGKVAAFPITRVGEVLGAPLGLAAALDDVAWRRKEDKSSGRDRPEPIVRTIASLIGTYASIVGARGMFQAASHWTKISGGEKSIGRAIATMASGIAAPIIIPGKQFLTNLRDFFYGPVDQSSIESAIAYNFPVLGAAWNYRAMNRFGDQLYDQSWYAKVSQLGFPVALRVKQSDENDALYGMLVQKGAAPPQLRRYLVEERFGPLTDYEWSNFVKTSGSILKNTVIKSLGSLRKAEPYAVKEFLEQAGQAANAEAAAKLHMVPQPGRKVGSGYGTGGGGAGTVGGGAGTVVGSGGFSSTGGLTAATPATPKAVFAPKQASASPTAATTGRRVSLSVPRLTYSVPRLAGATSTQRRTTGLRTARKRYVTGTLKRRSTRSVRRVGTSRITRKRRVVRY